MVLDVDLRSDSGRIVVKPSCSEGLGLEAAELQRSSNSMHVEGSCSAARRSWDLSLKYDGVESMDRRMTYWTSIFGTG